MSGWALPKFGYGQHVKITSCEGVEARIVDLHHYGQTCTVEYDVVYFESGKRQRVRVFEDELEARDV